jgi:REP element-mobilizing transposase RayT
VSFWRLYYHLVWATKNREPLITPEIEGKLYAYTVRKAAERAVYVYAINGWYDHMHLVVAIPPKQAISDVVKTLKGASSHYLNQDQELGEPFAWQRGYGALTLGERQRPQAEAYVRDQKTHHAQQTANAWLERHTQLDEGPASVGLQMDGLPSSLREDRPDYLAWGEPPF